MASLRRHPQRRWSYTAFAGVDAAAAESCPGPGAPAQSGWIMEKMLADETIIALRAGRGRFSCSTQWAHLTRSWSCAKTTELWLRWQRTARSMPSTSLTLIRLHRQLPEMT